MRRSWETIARNLIWPRSSGQFRRNWPIPARMTSQMGTRGISQYLPQNRETLCYFSIRPLASDIKKLLERLDAIFSIGGIVLTADKPGGLDRLEGEGESGGP